LKKDVATLQSDIALTKHVKKVEVEAKTEEVKKLKTKVIALNDLISSKMLNKQEE